MRSPSVGPVAVVMGWILVVGGLIETVDMLLHSSHLRSVLTGFLHGPAMAIGLGLALWLLARR